MEDPVIDNRASIEDFQNQEKEIEAKMKYSDSILMKKNPSLGNISEVYDDPNNQQENGEGHESEGEEEEDYEMKFPSMYHSQQDPDNTTVQEQIVGNDGKVQRSFLNGKKEVIFSNGVRRETNPDGYTIVYFNNNDIKQTYPD